MKQRGYYLVLEGDEGAGKTTQLELLKKRLKKAGIKTEIVREPGGDPVAEQLRDILKHSEHPIAPLAEMYGFCMARANMLEHVVRPKLDQGVWVLGDRNYLSTLIYQGEARGVNSKRYFRRVIGQLSSREVFEIIVTSATASAKPDLTFILDISMDTSAKRQGLRGDKPDRFEREGQEFRRRVNEGYRRLATEGRRGFVQVNADGAIEEIHDSIWKRVEQLIKRAERRAVTA